MPVSETYRDLPNMMQEGLEMGPPGTCLQGDWSQLSADGQGAGPRHAVAACVGPAGSVLLQGHHTHRRDNATRLTKAPSKTRGTVDDICTCF